MFWRNKSIYQSGFTLLELLISICIIGLLTCIVYSAFSGSISFHQRLVNRIEDLQNVYACTKILAKRLQNIYILPIGNETTFAGEETKIRFTTLSSDGSVQLNEIIFVPEMKAIKLKEKAKVQDLKERRWREVIIVSDIEKLTFSYWGKDFAWHPSWGINQKTLPFCVKIEIKITKNGKKTDIPPVLIPIDSRGSLFHMEGR